METSTCSPRFSFGQAVITSNAQAQLNAEDVYQALGRHAREDWGEVCPEDAKENDNALLEGGRLLSVYTDRNGTKFWIITEWDRSATTVLLPEDY
jgi:hypothetical protein